MFYWVHAIVSATFRGNYKHFLKFICNNTDSDDYRKSYDMKGKSKLTLIFSILASALKNKLRWRNKFAQLRVLCTCCNQNIRYLSCRCPYFSIFTNHLNNLLFLLIQNFVNFKVTQLLMAKPYGSIIGYVTFLDIEKSGEQDEGRS